MKVFFNAKIGRLPNTASKGYFQKEMCFNKSTNPLIIKMYYESYLKKLEALYKKYFVTGLGMTYSQSGVKYE